MPQINNDPAALHPVFADKSNRHIEAWNRNHPDMLIGRFEGFRTFERQADLYAQGRTKPSSVGCVHDGVARPVGSCPEHRLGLRVTNAPPGLTWHNYGVANDIVFDADPVKPALQASWGSKFPWDKMGALGQAMGLEWAGAWKTFRESPHFQITFGLQITEALELYQQAGGGNNGLTAVWLEMDKR